MSNKDVKFSLKVVMNEQNTKVLFAEAGADFANVLLSFLTLPLGRIVRLLQEQYGADETPAIGSITTLYNGLANLDVANFTEEGVKQMLLDPKRSCSPVKYFCCGNVDCLNTEKYNMSLYHGIARCDCGKLITREVHSTLSGHVSESDDDVGGVFAASGVSFVVSDDLRVLPNVPGSVIQILRIADADFGNMQNLTFDFKEIMDLLKGLFLSRTPLTDVVLNNGKINYASPSEPKILLPEVEKRAYSSTSGEMTLKVTLQTSTNKLLFAQAESQFIEVLFSLLAIPLGGVERLLNGNTTIENIDNLYQSVVEHIDEKYFESGDAICSLVAPKVPHGYMLGNQILRVEEEKACKIYYYRGDDYVSLDHRRGSCVKVTNFNFPTGYSYVKGPRLYMIYDDLTVEPSGMTSYLCKLSMLKIPLSDVNELELHIGSEEVLSILKAALVSKCALSYGLRPLLAKQPKQEH